MYRHIWSSNMTMPILIYYIYNLRVMRMHPPAIVPVIVFQRSFSVSWDYSPARKLARERGIHTGLAARCLVKLHPFAAAHHYSGYIPNGQATADRCRTLYYISSYTIPTIKRFNHTVIIQDNALLSIPICFRRGIKYSPSIGGGAVLI